MGTKGTWRRDAAVSDDELARRWAETFGGERVLEGDSYRVVSRTFPPEPVDPPKPPWPKPVA